MRGKTKIISTFCLSVFVQILIGVYAYKNINDYKDESDSINHTQETIFQAQKILSDVQAIETAQRGYVITGAERYLKSYNEALKNIGEIDLLKNLIKNNPQQQALIDTIHSTINLKVDFTKKTVAVLQTKGIEFAQQRISSEVGENLMKKIREQFHEFIENEKELLSKQLSSAKQNVALVIRVIIASVILTIFIVLTTLYFFMKYYSKRVLSEKKLHESELRLKKFLDSLPIGVFVLNADGRPYYANNKSQNILGKGIMPDASAEDLSEVYKAYIAGSSDLYPSDRQPIVRALRGEKNICVEDIEILKGDIRIPLRINATSVTNSQDKIEYAIAVFDDISNIKEAEQKLIEAKKLAEESVILKETFLANMSHEIRTPMNAILGFTDLLLKQKLQMKEREYVQIIKTSGENLLRIINDILDVSKMESGMMTFEELPISIKELFGSLNILFSQKVKEKILKLSFECDAGFPDTVLGDPTRLTQILLNLVGNAIKFTTMGSIEVFAKILKEEKEAYQVEFFVKDTGIGIPEDKLQHVFERFRQAESHTTRKYGGTGLGLNIAKQLVELQGGNITIKSTVGVGSVFSFTLSFKKTNKKQPNVSTNYNEFNTNDLSKIKILLAEDNPINIKFVLSLFSDYNIHPDVAENGKMAIEKIKKNHYDIVLMDIEMPEMNGYETTIVIRNELKKDIPIIAMTAHVMAGEKEKCLQLGMNDYISKPIKSDLLFEKMFRVVLPKIKNANSGEQKNKIVNLNFLTESMRGKRDVIRETIDIFLTQFPEDLAIINEAIKKTDYSTIKNFSHRMKSTVSLMGISAMENILEEMETLGNSKNEIEKINVLSHSLNRLSEQAMQEIQIEKLNYT